MCRFLPLSRVKVPSHVLMREVDGEMVLLNTKTEIYYELDDVGTRMLEALRSRHSVREAEDALLMEFEVEPDHLRHDLLDLLSKLVERGLAEVTESPPDPPE